MDQQNSKSNITTAASVQFKKGIILEDYIKLQATLQNLKNESQNNQIQQSEDQSLLIQQKKNHKFQIRETDQDHFSESLSQQQSKKIPQIFFLEQKLSNKINQQKNLKKFNMRPINIEREMLKICPKITQITFRNNHHSTNIHQLQYTQRNQKRLSKEELSKSYYDKQFKNLQAIKNNIHQNINHGNNDGVDYLMFRKISSNAFQNKSIQRKFNQSVNKRQKSNLIFHNNQKLNSHNLFKNSINIDINIHALPIMRKNGMTDKFNNERKKSMKNLKLPFRIKE